MTAAEVIPLPEHDRIVVRVPVGDTWNMLDLLDIQAEMHFNPREMDAASPEAMYMSVIADIWLQLRETEPGITWREAAKRYTAADLARDVNAAMEAMNDPKGSTRSSTGARRSSR